MHRWFINYMFNSWTRTNKPEESASSEMTKPHEIVDEANIVATPDRLSRRPLSVLWEVLTDPSIKGPNHALAIVRHPSCGVRCKAELDEYFEKTTYSEDGNAVQHSLKIGQGSTPLMLAALADRLDVVELLVSKDNAFVIAHDHRYVTALHCASFNGNVPMIRLLIDKGCTPSIAEALEPSPFQLAAQQRHMGAIQLLLSKGYSCYSSRVGSVGGSLLHWAALKGLSGPTEALLQRDFRLWEEDRSGMSPLHIAARSCDVSTVKTLLAYGADINAKCHRDMIPLQIALWYRAPQDLLEALLDCGSEGEQDVRNGTRMCYCK